MIQLHNIRSLAEFGKSEMLVEESTDIFNIISKANYSADKAAAYAKALGEDVPAQLKNVEKLLKGKCVLKSQVPKRT